MRLALGQGCGDQRGRRGKAGQPVGIINKTRGMGADQFAGGRPQMLGEPTAPDRCDLVARLQDGAQFW